MVHLIKIDYIKIFKLNSNKYAVIGKVYNIFNILWILYRVLVLKYTCSHFLGGLYFGIKCNITFSAKGAKNLVLNYTERVMAPLPPPSPPKSPRTR